MSAFGAAFATIALWAGSFPAIAIGVRHVDAVGLAAVRFAIAAAMMGLLLAWRRERLPCRLELMRVVFCGLIGIALYNVLLNAGQRTVSPGAASFIIATQPIFAAGIVCLLGIETVRLPAMAGTALSVLGVGVVSFGESPELHFGDGPILVLAAAVCSGAYFVLQRPLAMCHGAITSASWTIVAGAAFLTPWLPLGLTQVAKSHDAMAATAFLGLGAGALGYVCWMKALAGLGAARAANLLFLMAPVATVISIPVTGHVPGLSTVVGGAMALAGVAIVNQTYRRVPAEISET